MTSDAKEELGSKRATPQSTSRTRKQDAQTVQGIQMASIEEEPPLHGSSASAAAGKQKHLKEKPQQPTINQNLLTYGQDEEDEDEDDDDAFLHSLTISNMKKSIQHAIESKKVSLKPLVEEKDDEDEEEEEDEEEGAKAGPSDSVPAAKSDRIMHWRPEINAKDIKLSSSAAQRLVHQREIGKVQEKDPSLRKELLLQSNDPSKIRKAERKNAPDTAGKKWFDLPATKIDDEAKRELRLLRLRGAFDPKTFYKGFDTTKLPKFFQMGTVVDNPLDFYGGRLSNSERKSTLTEQLLADPDVSHSRKKRYDKMQVESEKYSKGKKRKAGAHISQQPRSKKNIKHRER